MKVLLRITGQSINTPVGGVVLTDPLPWTQEFEFESDEESINRDVVTNLIEIGDSDNRILDYEVFVSLGKNSWDKPFDLSTFTPIPPGRLKRLRKIIARRLKERSIERTSRRPIR